MYLFRLRSQCQEEDYVGNCTNREWVATKVDNLQVKLSNISETLKEIGPVWKKEFISLFAFLPWSDLSKSENLFFTNFFLRYGFANVLLIIGAVKEIRVLLIIWVVATLAVLVWEFVLLSILFSYDTTVGRIKFQEPLFIKIRLLFIKIRLYILN